MAELPGNLFNCIRDEGLKRTELSLDEPQMPIQNELIQLSGQSPGSTLFCEMYMQGANATLKASVSPKGDAALKSMLQGKSDKASYEQSLKDVSRNWDLRWDMSARKWIGPGMSYTNHDLATEICTAMK
jgi:hypothetical protein